MSATNVSLFAQPKKHHEQQCVRNNVSSFGSTFKITNLYQVFLGTNKNDITLNDSSVNTFARLHTYVIFVDRDLVHWTAGLNPRRREKHRMGITFVDKN